MSLRYIDIPFDFVYRFSTGVNSFSINFGPPFGLLTSATADSEDVKEQFKSSEISAGLGIAYEINKLIIGLSGSRSLSNIISEDLEGAAFKNSVGTLYIGYN